MAGRRKKSEPTKRSALLGPYRQVCLSSVSMLALQVAMPPARSAPRDRVHYYSDGQKHVVDLETSHGL